MGRQSDRVRLDFPPASWRWSAWQREVWDDSADLDGASVFDLCCGRGSGKDIVSIRCALRDAFKLWARYKEEDRLGHQWNDETKPVPTRNPRVKVFVVAPQENNLKQAWDDWHGTLRALAAEWRISWAETDDPEEHGWFFRHVVRERKFVLFGRGEIEIEARLSSTKDALRGPGVDITHWTEFAVETVPGELERAYDGELAGTMTRSGRHGRVYRTTTPKGPSGGYYNKIKKEFGEDIANVSNGKRVKPDGRGVYYNFDSLANEFLTKRQREEIEKEKALGWFYDQERGARFVISDKGGSRVFARALVYACVVAEPLLKEGGARRHEEVDARLAHRMARAAATGLRRVTFGVDIARYGDDFTAYVGVDQDSAELVHLERHKHISGRAVVKDLERLSIQFPGCLYRVDSTGHKGYIADFLPTGLRARVEETEFSRRKEKWVLGLQMLFELERLRIPDPERFPGLSPEMQEAIRQLLKELLMFVKVIKQSGELVYTHPPGENDDCLDGLILASMDLAENLKGPMDVKSVMAVAQRLGL